MENMKKLSPAQAEEILKILKSRFEKNLHRHKGLEWSKILEKLEKNPGKLRTISEMERTGGEPDVSRL
jgi:primosomal protein N''